MARPKKVETDTASIVEEKNSTVETENTETNELFEEKEEVKSVQAESEKPVENKPKTLGKTVFIKCESLAGKKLSLPTRTVEFDENGNCEVTGEEANRLLTIPGYELTK